jgi:glycosyltransferase involved in cell wall biosynthesis
LFEVLPMKIGILTGTFHPEPGGPPTYLYHLLPALQGRGHQLRVLTYGEPHEYPYGYPVTRISRRMSIPRRLLQYIRAAIGLVRWADVLYVQGYTIPLLALRPFIRGRIVAKVVSDFSWEYARRHHLTDLDVVAFQIAPHSAKVRLLRWTYKTAMFLSEAVVVPSDHVAELVRGWGIPAERIHVIHNAIPESDLKHVDRAALRSELELTMDSRILVSVGRLTAVKGFDVAIRALAELPDCHLVIVGEGEQRAELERLATPYAERVTFVGRQPHNTALRYIRAANVFVLSSFTEGLSHVLLEALSVGTPAVATAVGGNSEILTDGVNGLLVPSGSPGALAGAIRRVIDQPEWANGLVQAGLARSQDFSWEATVAHTEVILCGDKNETRTAARVS